jgi:hypothetical protein
MTANTHRARVEGDPRVSRFYMEGAVIPITTGCYVDGMQCNLHEGNMRAYAVAYSIGAMSQADYLRIQTEPVPEGLTSLSAMEEGEDIAAMLNEANVDNDAVWAWEAGDLNYG